MKIVWTIVALTLMSSLLFISQIWQVKQDTLSDLLMLTQHSLTQQGRELFTVATTLDGLIHVPPQTRINQLRHFQQDPLFQATYFSEQHSSLLHDWPQLTNHIQQHQQLVDIKAEFQALDFDLLSDAELVDVMQDWRNRFVSEISSVQKHNIQLTQYLTALNKNIEQTKTRTNLTALLTLLLTGIALYFSYHRRYFREIEASKQIVQDRNAELEQIQTILYSQSEDLAHERNALREAECRTRTITQFLPVGVILVNAQGKICEVNNQACQLFGYSEAELMNMQVEQLVPEGTRHNHSALRESFAHNQQPRIMAANDQTLAGQCKDGSRVPLEIGLAPVMLNEERFIVVSLLNVEERRRALQQLQEKNVQMDIALENLRQSNEQLKEFAYRTSHDLRSPLISAIKLLDIIRSTIQNNETEKSIKFLDITQNSLKKLESLVSDILQLTKMNHLEENWTPLDIKTIYEDSLNSFSHMEGFERITFSQNFSHDKPINTQKEHLVLVIENLISNAIKYQDFNKDNSSVCMSTQQVNETIVITVEDNGLGIPESAQENLFKMFKRLHPNTAFGSGLGLYMVKRSVEKLDGTIHFEGTDKSSRFIVTLPIKPLR